MLEEYTIPALLICFVTGVVIGINVGMICSRTDDVPNFVFRPENLPLRYPGHRGFADFSGNRAPMEPTGKRRMANQWNL